MWLPTTIILIVINTIVFSAYSTDPLIVTLPKGKIQGHILKTFINNTYYAFQEIPYAAPPVGSLRYSDPVDPESWEGVLNTTQNTKICPQWVQDDAFLIKGLESSEDCLYINVFTPCKRTDELLPVLFFIHGGGFHGWDGSYQRWGPQFFIDQNVIVVSLNYRLGPLGYLYTSDGVIPANLGQKDQLMALRWVNENIALFGGDPEKVTISGESSAAGSVGYHVVSKRSSGLFKGAILQSGTSISDFSYQPHGDYFAYRMGKALDPSFTTSNTTQELLTLLRNVSAEDMMNVTISDIPDEFLHEYAAGEQMIWSPTVEKFDTVNAFVTNSTFELLDSGDFNRVSLLMGFTSEEGLVLNSNNPNLSGAKIDNNLVWAVGNNFNLNSSSAEKAGKLIRSIYTNSTFEEDYPALVRFVSEKVVVSSVVRHAEMQSKYADVYLYQFSHRGPIAIATQNYSTVAGEKVESVGHAEEMAYLWSTKDNSDLSKFPDSDVFMLRRITKLWANFVKYSNPTPEEDEFLDNYIWPKFKSDDRKFVNITQSLMTRENPKNALKWWEIIDEYGVRPFNL